MRVRASARGLALCAAAAVMLVAGCSGNADNLRKRLDAQNEQLAALKRDNGSLAKRLDEANRKLGEADRRLTQMQAQASEEAAQAAEDPYADRTENDLLVDRRLPADAAGLLLRLIETVNAKPKADDQIWARFFQDPSRMRYFIESVLAKPELTYVKLFYQGETTYAKPGKETVSMVVVGKLKTEGAHAFAMTDTNGAGWTIVDVD